jgi:hypothetical protein
MLLAEFLTRNGLYTLRFFVLPKNMIAIWTYDNIVLSWCVQLCDPANVATDSCRRRIDESMRTWGLRVVVCVYSALREEQIFLASLEEVVDNFVQMKVHLLPMPSFFQILFPLANNTVLYQRARSTRILSKPPALICRVNGPPVIRELSPGNLGMSDYGTSQFFYHYIQISPKRKRGLPVSFSELLLCTFSLRRV